MLKHIIKSHIKKILCKTSPIFRKVSRIEDKLDQVINKLSLLNTETSLVNNDIDLNNHTETSLVNNDIDLNNYIEKNPKKIFNSKIIKLDHDGERLVPGISHNIEEDTRHKSTYQLYKKIIIEDIVKDITSIKNNINILDLGCGSGHGAFMLSEIPNSQVYAIDIDKNIIEYAKKYYFNENIHFILSSIENFINNNKIKFDYVVSRGVLEHVDEGVEIALKIKYRKRQMISVPYKELPGNTFHLHLDMDENIFKKFKNTEFFYESIEGLTDKKVFTTYKTNMFTCVVNKKNIPPVNSLLNFPIPKFTFHGIEKHYFEIFN